MLLLPALAILTACGQHRGEGLSTPSAPDSVAGGDSSPAPGDSTGGSATSSGSLLLTGATVVGVGLADVRVEDGRIAAVGPGLSADGAEVVDLGGLWLTPAFIDSHVHLAYLPEVEAMAAGGVAAAIDLAAPLSFLAEDHSPLRILAAGPMVTAEGGYPTQSWGRDGYGWECSGVSEAVEAVDGLFAAGAGAIKIPINGSPQLSDEAIESATARAHAHGLRVASHATQDDEAALAARLGVDALAHTPTEALSPSTLAAWRGGAVISTLRAFGGGSATIANLSSLREAGAIVLYGTDFGNTRTPGIDGDEIALMQTAGLSGKEILAAGTSAPAAFWGFDDLGSIEVGKAASLLVLSTDPSADPGTLAVPVAVYLDGVRQ